MLTHHYFFESLCHAKIFKDAPNAEKVHQHPNLLNWSLCMKGKFSAIVKQSIADFKEK